MPEVTLDQLINEAAGGDVTPEPTQDTVADDEQPEQNVQPDQDNQDTQVTTQDPTDATKVEEKKEEQKKSNPMKEVRDKLNQEQSARKRNDTIMNRFADGDYKFKLKDFKDADGKIDYEALAEAMDNADSESKAKTNNITPEMQKELERIQREKIEITRKRLEADMQVELANMQVEMGLNKAQINEFFSASLKLKINPYMWLQQGGNMSDLYFVVNKEKIIADRVEKAVAEERAKWESTPQRTHTSNPAKTVTKPQVTDTNKISLDELLKEVGK